LRAGIVAKRPSEAGGEDEAAGMLEKYLEGEALKRPDDASGLAPLPAGS
jgi:hypothetical protein